MARALTILALAIGALFGVTTRADAQDAQLSTRLVVGGGGEWPDGVDVTPLFELGLRAELLIGPARADSTRLGPAIDVRTANFGTFEAAGGAFLLLPFGYDFAGMIMLGGGYAARTEGRDGAIGVVTLRAGYQPYDHFDFYSHGVSIYLSARVGLAGVETYELTAGVEIDFEFLVWSPFAFLVTAFSGGDPDEPEEAESAASQ